MVEQYSALIDAGIETPFLGVQIKEPRQFYLLGRQLAPRQRLRQAEVPSAG